MGLDFSHGNARWGYVGFNRFRVRVARAAKLDAVADWYDAPAFGPDKPAFPYESLNNHPLEPFLNHSDCEGELTVEDMKLVEPELRTICERFEEVEYDYDKDNGLKLCAGMREAIKANEPLEFT